MRVQTVAQLGKHYTLWDTLTLKIGSSQIMLLATRLHWGD